MKYLSVQLIMMGHSITVGRRVENSEKYPKTVYKDIQENQMRNTTYFPWAENFRSMYLFLLVLRLDLRWSLWRVSIS